MFAVVKMNWKLRGSHNLVSQISSHFLDYNAVVVECNNVYFSLGLVKEYIYIKKE